MTLDTLTRLTDLVSTLRAEGHMLLVAVYEERLDALHEALDARDEHAVKAALAGAFR